MPKGIAIATAMAVAITTKVSVWIMGTQRSKFQIRPKPKMEPRAKRQLEARQQIKAKTIINAHSGTAMSMSFSESIPVWVKREILRVTPEYWEVKKLSTLSIQALKGRDGMEFMLLALLLWPIHLIRRL